MRDCYSCKNSEVDEYYYEDGEGLNVTCLKGKETFSEEPCEEFES